MIRFIVKHTRPSIDVPFFRIPDDKRAAYVAQFEVDNKTSCELISLSSDGLEKIEQFTWTDAAMAEWDSQWAPEFDAARDAYESSHGIIREVILLEKT